MLKDNRKVLQKSPTALMYLIPIIVGFAAPYISVFCAFVLVYGFSSSEVSSETFLNKEIDSLVLIGTIIPFLLLSIICDIQLRTSTRLRAWRSFGVGITVLLICICPLYILYWRDLYLEQNLSSTGSLIFIFIPLYSCIILVLSLLATEGVALLVSKLKS